ncbi:hypothetical protein DFQ27_007469 [Actinomortierella ambigua]|uniref:Uncharacterized protein n=1 Tax=Actinomortierella ambigua TaxID=1343610 RepID=A0A9P6QKV2_9FUNG|nr:hypothetical protein DFQ27_007469 [Actinomortierella ambigua]
MILPRKRSIASFSSSPSSSSNAASRSKDTTKKAAAVVAAKAAALNLKEGRDLSSAASVIIVKGTAPNFSEQRLKRQRQHSSSSSSLYSAYEAIVNSDSQMPVFLTHDRITRQGKKKPVAVKSLAENQTHSKPLRPFVRVAVPSPSSDGDMAQVDNNNKEEEEDELVEGKAKAQVDVEEEMDHSALIQEEADYSNNSEMEDRDTAAEPDNYISAATLSYDTMDTTVEEVVGSTDDGDGDAEDIDLLGNRVAAPAPAPAPPSTLPASDDAYDDNEETRYITPRMNGRHRIE